MRTIFLGLTACFLMGLSGCSCSSDSTAHVPEGEKPSNPDAGWIPPIGIQQCDSGRDRKCLHADADGDGASVAQGDCDDADRNSLTKCRQVPTLPAASSCDGSDCSNADLDGDGMTPAQGDCDDAERSVYYGAPDPCGDGVDNDCDGFDSSCEQADQDGDGYTVDMGDCDDSDAKASPRAPEVCSDGIDNDCDGFDPSCQEVDEDGDGQTPRDGDCDDADANATSGTAELCGDGIDNDCDGTVDQNCVLDLGLPLNVPLGTDEPLTIRVRVALPKPEAGELGGDVMFLVDQSASFEDDIATFKSSASSISERLSETFQDLRIGLAGFRDAPCLAFGSDLEWAYALHVPLTTDLGAFQTSLDTLVTAPGGTTPEAALEGMAQVLTGRGHTVQGFGSCDGVADIAPSQPGWERGRIPLLIVSTDAPFNRPGDEDYPYPSSVTDVIQLSMDSGTRVFFMTSGERDPEDVLIADATGGQVFELESDSSGIVGALGSALDASLSDVTVELVARGPGARVVQGIDPPLLVGVNLLAEDEVEFEVTFRRTITRKSRAQVFEFDLVLVTEGADGTRIPVTVTIPGIDV